MSKLVTIFGGSGFVGRYIARRMAKEGWRVRIAVRRPNEATFVKPYGAVGQVEPVFCNIRSDDSVRAAMSGADAVVNCVGILSPSGANQFGSVQHEGAARVARIASEEGVGQLVHLSSIGSNVNSKSAYSRTKALGEQAVQELFPAAVILKPSVIFGPEDGFFNKFAKMSRFGPVLPIVGGNTRYQPVYVDDVAQAAVRGVTGQAKAGIYELGGPDTETFNELMARMLDLIQRRRVVLDLPVWVAGIIAGLLGAVQAISVGLFTNTVLTRDQIPNLLEDNVVSPGAKTLADLGIQPTPMAAVLGDYLWPYRPSGQYAAIKKSAKNLRV